jgi:hypothetical protein
VADRTKLSERPPTCWHDAGDPLDKYAGLLRIRLPCDLTLFCSADSDFVSVCTTDLGCTDGNDTNADSDFVGACTPALRYSAE